MDIPEDEISNVRRVEFKSHVKTVKTTGESATVTNFLSAKRKKEEKALEAKMTVAATQFMSYIGHTLSVYESDELSLEEVVEYAVKVRRDYKYLADTDKAYELMFTKTLQEYQDWDLFSIALHAILTTDKEFKELLEEITTLFKGPTGSQVWVFVGEGHNKDFSIDDPVIFDTREQFLHFLTDDSNLTDDQKKLYHKLKKDYDEFMSKKE